MDIKKSLRKTVQLTAVSSVIFMVGCKLDVTQELYSSDLRDVAVNATTGLMSTMTMAIEIPSVKNCEEYASKIADVMSGLIHGFVLKGCKNFGVMDSRMMMDVQIPLLHNEELWQQSDSLFGVLLAKTPRVLV